MRRQTLIWVWTTHPKLVVFSTFSKYIFLCCLITQLIKHLQQWSLYEVNTKRHLSNIWLLSYKHNSFGCFWKIGILFVFWKHPKLFFLNNQISLRGHFVLKPNGRISTLTSYKDHRCSLFMSWVIKHQRKLHFENVKKNTQLWVCGSHPNQCPSFHFMLKKGPPLSY